MSKIHPFNFQIWRTEAIWRRWEKCWTVNYFVSVLHKRTFNILLTLLLSGQFHEVVLLWFRFTLVALEA